MFRQESVSIPGAVISGTPEICPAHWSVRVSIGTSQAGLLLVDSSLSTVAANLEAIQILTFPNKPERIKRLEIFLADKVRSGLVNRQSPDGLEFVKEFKSGNRHYLCRTF